MDAPQDVTNRAHTAWELTNPELAFVRLHGRNADTWSATGGTSVSVRFDYDCSDDALRKLSGPILDIANRAAKTHVIFKNSFEDQAQRNARALVNILGEQYQPPTEV
jgi:uncharacterized protein YecE (DUF72 family)